MTDRESLIWDARLDKAFKSLCDNLERIKKERDEASGSYAELLRQLKDKFGVASLKDAKALLTRLAAKDLTLASAEDAELARLEKKYPKLFKGE